VIGVQGGLLARRGPGSPCGAGWKRTRPMMRIETVTTADEPTIAWLRATPLRDKQARGVA
jgi:hypothetical protein